MKIFDEEQGPLGTLGSKSSLDCLDPQLSSKLTEINIITKLRAQYYLLYNILPQRNPASKDPNRNVKLFDFGSEKGRKKIDNLVAVKNTGLANRIRNIVSCLRIDPDAKIFWDSHINIKNSDMTEFRDSCKFSSLFENKNIEVSFSDNVPRGEILKMASDPGFWVGHGLYPCSSWRLALFNEDEVPEGFSTYIDKFAPDGRSIDFIYKDIPESAKKEYIELFKFLKVKKDILDDIESFSKNNFNQNTISVHMRSFSDYAGQKGILSGVYRFDLKSFISEMNKQPDSSNFFICSDSDDALGAIKEEFGNRVIVRDVRKRTNRDDLIDLYLLSKNSKIIGTYKSTFTDVAWWLSECKSDITII